LAAETNKSAITDHVAKENHVIDWSGAKIFDRESHQKKDNSRNQSACVRRSTVWTDGGAYNLPTTYDHISVTPHRQCHV